MRFLKAFVCLFYFLPFLLFSQTQKSDLTRFTYEELTKLYFDKSKPDVERDRYADAYIEKAAIEKNDMLRAKGYCWKALLNYDKNNEKAILLFDEALKLTKEKKDDTFPMVVYFEKAMVLRKQRKFKEAIQNFILSEKSNFSNDIEYTNVIKLNIAVIKSNYLGDVVEGLEMLKESLIFYRKQANNDKLYMPNYHEVLFDIAESYRMIKKNDSATYYNSIGYKSARKFNDFHMKTLFTFSEGTNLCTSGKYSVAIDSLRKALPNLVKLKDNDNILSTYYYLGKSYEGIGKEQFALNYYLKIDSIYLKNKNLYPEFVDGYPFLINYYKKKGDKVNQLKYITNYMSVDSMLKKDYKELNKLIHKKYDIPVLIKEKENLITELKSSNKSSRFGIVSLILLVVLSSTYAYFQYRQKKNYKLNFDKLISNVSEVDKKEDVIKPTTPKELSEDLVSKILFLLDDFESNHRYIKQNISVQSLSSEFETNSKYLSNIINQYKGKTFIQYLNDLRIDFAVNTLKSDKKIRKYTINSMALEFGFNNAESFSTAFYKKTGIKPSYFVKELGDSII